MARAVGGGGGGPLTFTTNEHDAFCWFASVAVAVTVVMPTAKFDPLAGADTTEIGAVPPVTVGAGYETAIPVESVAVAF